MIGFINYTQAKAVTDYLRYLPGNKEDGDIWFYDWLTWLGDSTQPEKADVFQIGVYSSNKQYINDLLRILGKFGAYPTSMNNRFEGDIVDTPKGKACIMKAPIAHQKSLEYYIPNNMSQAFDEGIRILTKYSDFSFPIAKNDMWYLNSLLSKMNALLRGTSYDTASNMWNCSFVEYEAMLKDQQVLIYCTSPYARDAMFNPSNFLCHIQRFHAIAKAIGADTTFHMHHGFRTAQGLPGIALVNEPQKIK